MADQMKDITRLSREDILGGRALGPSFDPADCNGDQNNNNNNNNNNNDNNSIHDDDDDVDFRLHDLKSLVLNKSSLINNRTKFDDLNSNSSSSAASTVIHNPNLEERTETADMLVSSVNLKTLESDPELHTKLHQSLKLSQCQVANNTNSNNNNSITGNDNDIAGDNGNTTLNDSTVIDDDDDDDDEGEVANTGNNNEKEQRDTAINTDSLYIEPNDDESDDRLDDYSECLFPSPPSSPPRELDPTKLYALFDFNGPDPSHLELFKDDSVLLVNDSDSYWWLVRRVDNNKIGFAPAEILETYSERLARLNCWKNEILERGGYDNLKYEEEKKLFTTHYPIHHTIENNLSHEVSLENIKRKGSLKYTNSISTTNIINNNENNQSNNTKTVSFADINDVREASEIDTDYESESGIESIYEEEEEGLESDAEKNDTNNNNDSSIRGDSFSLLDGYQQEYSLENISLTTPKFDVLPLSQDASSDYEEYNDNNEIDDLGNTIPLYIPKGRKNFMIKNLDDYKYSSDDENYDDINEVHNELHNNLHELHKNEEIDKHIYKHKQEPKFDQVNKTEHENDETENINRDSETKKHDKLLNRGVTPELTPSSSNSLDSTPTINANIKDTTVTTCCSESSSSTDSLHKHQKQLNPDLKNHSLQIGSLFVPKIRGERKYSNNGSESRLESLKLLDELLEQYPDYVSEEDVADNSVEENAIKTNKLDQKVNDKDNVIKERQVLGEGYISEHDKLKKFCNYDEKDINVNKNENEDKGKTEGRIQAARDVESTKGTADLNKENDGNNKMVDQVSNRDEELHPKTAQIFNPLFLQMQQLDQLLGEIQK